MAIFDISYVGEMPYLKLTGGTVTGATTFNSSVNASSISTTGAISAGSLSVSGTTTLTGNLSASTINGVTVGSSPKFTDTTYSVATTSANGLMAAADKTAVNKIGSGTLNTTNKTIIPAINELATKGLSHTTFQKTFSFTSSDSWDERTQNIITINKPCILCLWVSDETITTKTSDFTNNRSISIRMSTNEWFVAEGHARNSFLNSSTSKYTTTDMKPLSDNATTVCNVSTGDSLEYSLGSLASYTPTGGTAIKIRSLGQGLTYICFPSNFSLTSYSVNLRTYHIQTAGSITISGYYIPLA